jgi:histidyl-tRNA synthetase
MRELDVAPQASAQADIYVVAVGDPALTAAVGIAEKLRDSLPGHALVLHNGGGSFKSQMKKADKSGARLALIMGDQEVSDGTAAIKPLRGDGAGQEQVAQADLACRIQEILQ